MLALRFLMIGSLTLLVGCGKSEVEACNSADVARVILDGSLGEYKRQKMQQFKDNPRFAGYTGKIVNIRQSRYDEKNNTRYCAADFEYGGDLNWVDRLDAKLLGQVVCEKSFTYKIEKTLDKQNDFYVTWRCSQ